MKESPWSPIQYARFRAERRLPFLDLMALVRKEPGMRVVDLGCGTGELTRELHGHLAAKETLGIDTSETMLEKSAAYAADGLRFERGDIARFSDDGAYDLVFSNAALQWIPDHEERLLALTKALALRGQLAVQVPAMYDHPSHTVAAELAGESPFREALSGYRHRPNVLRPEAYALAFHRLGYQEQTVRLQVYGHLLGSREDVVEWVLGTLLTGYRERLAPALWEQFLARYRERLLPRLEESRPFFYPFKRILAWARL